MNGTYNEFQKEPATWNRQTHLSRTLQSQAWPGQHLDILPFLVLLPLDLQKSLYFHYPFFKVDTALKTNSKGKYLLVHQTETFYPLIPLCNGVHSTTTEMFANNLNKPFLHDSMDAKVAKEDVFFFSIPSVYFITNRWLFFKSNFLISIYFNQSGTEM